MARRVLRVSTGSRNVVRGASPSDTDDESGGSEDYTPPTGNAGAQPGRPTRSSQSRPRGRPRISSGQPSRQTAASTLNKRKRSPKSARGRPVAMRAKRTQNSGPSARIPPWPHGLPYEILFQIFQYASYPLYDDQSQGTASVLWLLRTARVCKDFTEPAIGALYYSPPLLPPSRAHRLLHHLRSQSSSSPINYKSKIRFLDVNGVDVLTRKSNGANPVELEELVSLTPQLKGIGVHLFKDIPQFNGVTDYSRVTHVYRPSLFDELDKCGISLHYWKWNYHIMPTNDMPWANLSAIHSRPSFKAIRHLEITHLSDPTKNRTKKWQALGQELANALGQLPNLESLKLVRSRLYTHDGLLANLPYLKNLSIIDSEDLDAPLLGQILSTHGSRLTRLELNYNKRLNLTFLVHLATACPSLESFTIDLQCFNSPVSTGSTEPMFDVIIPVGSIPTWPARLQHIEMLHLRKWELSTAEPFFASLEESAESLPSLRTLIIQASIEFDWKDRIQFRDNWVPKLEEVFLRRKDPPTSVRHMIAARPKATGSGSQKAPDGEDSKNDNDNDDGDSDVPMISKLRARKSNAEVPSNPAPGPARAEAKGKLLKSSHFQGMCELVDIRIQNLRPMQTVFKEEDFIDDELSGDGDWNGEDVQDSGRHAW